VLAPVETVACDAKIDKLQSARVEPNVPFWSLSSMSGLTERIQLTPHERELILKYGYPFDRLEKALRRWSNSEAIKTISMSESELSMLIGELSRSFNHGETGSDEDAILDLCDRLEYAEKYGDGELDILF
jgi:hypothetical protein